MIISEISRCQIKCVKKKKLFQTFQNIFAFNENLGGIKTEKLF